MEREERRTGVEYCVYSIIVVYSGVSPTCTQNVPQSSLDELLPDGENGEKVDGDGSHAQHSR